MVNRNPRIAVLLIATCAIFSLFAIRLGYYQLIASGSLAAGAVAQRTPSFPLEIPRGQILDRNLVPLTDPRTRQTEVAFPQGLVIAPVTTRYGPRSVARHVVGHLVGTDNAGACGIEKRFDRLGISAGLKGKKPRSASAFVGADQGVIPGLGYRELPASPRSSVVLTLDIRVQRAVEAVLDDHHVEKGAVVVLDPSTGDVLAMASRPSYDQNDVAQSIDDPRSPLINRALQPYYPGSVFKVIVAAAALETGTIDPYVITACPGSIDVGGSDPIGCSHHDEPEVISMKDAMAYSCNPVFVSLAERTGGSQIVKYARALGIGSRWPELPEGVPGSISQPDSLRGLAHLAIGQEYVRATPLEMTAAISTIANGGYYRAPRLVSEVVSQDGRVVRTYPVSESTRALSKPTVSALRTWLEATVDYGTGQLAAVSEGGGAGKTGTPENLRTSPMKQSCDAWFVGWAPRIGPRYTIGVFVEDGESGPSRAAPIFRDIALRALKLGK